MTAPGDAPGDGGPGQPGLYADSLALLTDLYQLTMAQANWRRGRHRLHSVFHLTMRRCPHGGDFAIAAGIDAALDYAAGLRFDGRDLGYLATLQSRGGGPLFEPAFLDHLANLRMTCDVFAVAEGETLLAGSPMVRVEGPLLEAQLLETPFLNQVGVQSLVATRAARICHWAARATEDRPAQPVLEFGLRRAHGVDGAVGVSRAAYVGGCAATSNLLAGRLYGIPVAGTHAHSWVLSFEEEIASFRAYAEAFPDDTTLLVDTYLTGRGVERAAEVGKELRAAGHELVGVRLDSGDLAELSRAARRTLDEAGLEEAAVAASGDLDEERIAALNGRGARVDVWGVGSRLATSHGDPTFSGAYKLASIESGDGGMRPVAKISEDRFKRSLPGRLQVLRRLRADGRMAGDLLVDEDLVGEGRIDGEAAGTPLLRPGIAGGRRVRPRAGTEEARDRAARCGELLDWARVGAGPASGTPPAHGLELAVDPAVEQRFEELLERRRAGAVGTGGAAAPDPQST